MRKLLILLWLLFCALWAFNQPIVNRAGSANTVQDARFAALYNAYLPRYSDTTAANLQLGIDTSGAIIYTYFGKTLWYRQNSPKAWVQVGSGSAGGVSQSVITDTLQNYWRLTGNNVSDGKFLGSVNNRSVPFYTNNTFAAVIDSNQRFGIGTRLPTQSFSLEEKLWMYTFSGTQSRIQTASGYNLRLMGGGSEGISLIPNAYGSTPRIGVVEDPADVNRVYFNYISGGATEVARIGISERNVYIKGIADSTSIQLKATDDASVYIDSSRFALSKGTETASANDLSLPFDGNLFSITGNTQINAITTHAWQPGSIIYLTFTGTPTLKNNTAGGAGTAPLLLAGRIDYTAAAGDVIAIQYDGTNFKEIARSISGTAPNAVRFAVSGEDDVSGQDRYFSLRSIDDFVIDSIIYYELDAPSATYRSYYTLSPSGGHYLIAENASTPGLYGQLSAENTASNVELISPRGTTGLHNGDDGSKSFSLLAVGNPYMGMYFESTDLGKLYIGKGASINNTLLHGIRIDHNDSMSFQPPMSVLNIDSLASETSDTTNYKPIIRNPTTGTVKYLTSWPFGNGYTSVSVFSDSCLVITRFDNTSDTVCFSSGGGGGSGTVTDFIFTDANGFDGTVTTSTTTPTLSLTTSVSNTQLFYSNSGALTGDAAIIRSGAGAMTVGTSITSPLIIGGTGVADDITIQPTSGVGASGSEIYFKVGNNGATTAMTVYQENAVGMGGSNPSPSVYGLHVQKAANYGGNAASGGFYDYQFYGQWAAIGSVAAAGTTLTWGGYRAGQWSGLNLYVSGSAKLTFSSSLATFSIATVAMSSGRFELAKGANVVAANDLTLGGDGNLFTITGNTQINAITTTTWQSGSQIAFIFTGAPLLKNNTAGGANTATMLLAGRVDFQAAAGDYIAFQYDGTNWYETNRKLAATGGVYTFNSGLTESPAGTVRLGGTLLANATIATASQTLTISTATGAINPLAVTSTTGNAIEANATSGVAIRGINTGATEAVFAIKNSTVTNTLISTMAIGRQVSGGVGAAGAGGSLDFYVEVDDGSSPNVARIAAVTTSAAAASYSGKLDFYTTNATSSSLRMTLDERGSLILTGRLQKDQGADVASVAGAITLGTDGNVFEITGTNAITLISNVNWQNGSTVTLLFTSTASLVDGTANSGTDIGMELAGNTNFTGSAGATLTLCLSEIGGIQRFREVSRSVN